MLSAEEPAGAECSLRMILLQRVERRPIQMRREQIIRTMPSKRAKTMQSHSRPHLFFPSN
jgi:hypothetical protein